MRQMRVQGLMPHSTRPSAPQRAEGPPQATGFLLPDCVKQQGLSPDVAALEEMFNLASLFTH